MATAPVTTTSVDMPQVDPASTDMSWLPTPQVYGENPQPMSLNDILGGIQSQYNFSPVNYQADSYGAGRFVNTQPMGESYGAGRFISGDLGTAGVGSNVNTVMPSWFTPGEFNLETLSNVPQEVRDQIAAGEVYSGSGPAMPGSSDFGGNVFDSNPYLGLIEDPMQSVIAKLAGLVVPGAGALMNAVSGYNAAVGSNAMNTGLGAYGGEGAGTFSPLGAAALGAVGITPDVVETNRALLAQFNNQPENLYGYMAGAVDPTVSQIVDVVVDNMGRNVTVNEFGVIGNTIGEAINAQIADGKSLSEAVTAVAIANGVAPSDAAGYGINAQMAAVQAAIDAGIPTENIDPAALAAYNDPMGAFIDALGITGKISEQVQEAVTPINEQLNALSDQYTQLGLDQQEALNAAIADLNSNLSNQIGAVSSIVSDYQDVVGVDLGKLSDVVNQIQADLESGRITTQEAINSIAASQDAFDQALANIASSGASSQAPSSGAGSQAPSSGGGAVTSPVTDYGPVTGTPIGPATGSTGGSGGGDIGDGIDAGISAADVEAAIAAITGDYGGSSSSSSSSYGGGDGGYGGDGGFGGYGYGGGFSGVY